MSNFDEAVTKSLDDFMESYKIIDTKNIYTNGIELVPIFRVKQWEEYNNKDKEVERLNNIISELEKKLIYYFGDEFPREVDEILNESQELKGSDK